MKILAGEEIDANVHPSVGSFLYLGDQHCTGSLLPYPTRDSPLCVVTAAHCFSNIHNFGSDLLDLSFSLTANTGDSASEGGRFSVLYRKVPEENDKFDLGGDDIAIVRLAKLEAGIVPKAYLPLATKESDLPRLEQIAEVVGYGKKDDSESSGRKQRGLVTINGIHESEHGRGKIIMVGKGPDGQITCPGDSGGPLIHNGKIVGVVSGNGEGRVDIACTEKKLTQFASILHQQQWIDKTVKELCSDSFIFPALIDVFGEPVLEANWEFSRFPGSVKISSEGKDVTECGPKAWIQHCRAEVAAAKTLTLMASPIQNEQPYVFKEWQPYNSSPGICPCADPLHATNPICSFKPVSKSIYRCKAIFSPSRI